MKIIVQKFGGTSLDSAEKRSVAIEHIEEARAKGYGVVVVVSAMGRMGEPYATDTLLSLLGEGDVAERDRDALMACGEVISAVKFANALGKRGLRAIVLNGQQAGIVTDGNFGNARVVDVRPQRILDALQRGQIPVVTGFQGVTEDGDTTTLGRGGSDTTAVVVGAALGAECVEIFTDVDGVMTCDPRIVANAQTLTQLSYREMHSLACHGAAVLHPSAVEAAAEKYMPLRVRNTLSKSAGTLIRDESSNSGPSCLVGAKGIACMETIVMAELEPPDASELLTLIDWSDSMVEREGIQCAKITVVGDDVEEASRQSFGERIANALTQQGVVVFASYVRGNSTSYVVKVQHLQDAAKIMHRELFETSRTVAG